MIHIRRLTWKLKKTFNGFILLAVCRKIVCFFFFVVVKSEVN